MIQEYDMVSAYPLALERTAPLWGESYDRHLTPIEEFYANPLNPYVAVPAVVLRTRPEVPPVFDEAFFALVRSGLLTGVGVDVETLWIGWGYENGDSGSASVVGAPDRGTERALLLCAGSPTGDDRDVADS